MELKYIVYITVNTVNGKIYVGVHRTNPNIFDGYIGCGIYRQEQAGKDYPFHKAVKKYGYENFKRTTIQVFDDTDEGRKAAYDLESQIVTETFLKSKTVYNVAIGGKGGNNLDCMKRVYKFDLNGNYLQSYSTARDAALSLELENVVSAQKAIRNNCLGTVNSAFGFFWSYTKEFKYVSSKTVVPVAQYTVKGKFLRYFDSMTEAEQAFGVSTIYQAIVKGYLAGGYQWRYYNGDTSDIKPLINIMTKNHILPIIMSDKSGKIVKRYENVKACVDDNPELELIASQINRVLKHIIKSHKGWRFEYDINEDKDIV